MPRLATRALHLAAPFAFVAQAAWAQPPDVKPRPEGAKVSGVVHDSIGHAPLAGAWVQLVASAGARGGARTAIADSLGRFTFDDVPDGRYTVGFFHPILDSLGIEAPLREVWVARHRPVRADVGIPSATRLRAAICSDRPERDLGAVVVGVVRSAREGMPVAGATVTGEWHEISFRKGRIEHSRPRVVVTTAENGWFALCDMPKAGTMFLDAKRGGETTDLIEVQVPADGFLRQELYLGSARTVVLVDSTAPADTLVIPPARVRVGDGRLRGTVLAVDGNRPLAGALVRIADGPITVANDHGEWTLRDAPAGSRILEVRAVGFYSARVLVNVVPGAPPVRVSLSTFKAMLDTVRVTAERVADRYDSGFEERRRTGVGTYVTARDIARHGALFTSDIFRHVLGVRLGYAIDTAIVDVEMDVVGPNDRRILMRGIGSTWCAPIFYLNGAYVPDLDSDALDSWVRPEHLAGIEVYTEVTIPAAYYRLRNGCGAILIWTK